MSLFYEMSRIPSIGKSIETENKLVIARSWGNEGLRNVCLQICGFYVELFYIGIFPLLLLPHPSRTVTFNQRSGINHSQVRYFQGNLLPYPGWRSHVSMPIIFFCFDSEFLFDLVCVVFFFFNTIFIYLFIYLWLCWVFVSVRGLSLVAASGGHSSSRCAGLSSLRPLLLRSTGSRRAGSAVVAHGRSRSAACGILPDQGSNPCAPHWQADSQPLRHQGSPQSVF